jgi:hypothetical protein
MKRGLEAARSSPDPSLPLCSAVSRPSLRWPPRAASLDTTCAHRRRHPAVGARESLRPGRTKEMSGKDGVLLLTLHLPLPSRLENGRMAALNRTKGCATWGPFCAPVGVPFASRLTNIPIYQDRTIKRGTTGVCARRSSGERSWEAAEAAAEAPAAAARRSRSW